MSKKIYLSVKSRDDKAVLPEIKYVIKQDDDWKYDTTVSLLDGEIDIFYRNFELMSLPPSELLEKIEAVDGVTRYRLDVYTVHKKKNLEDKIRR